MSNQNKSLKELMSGENFEECHIIKLASAEDTPTKRNYTELNLTRVAYFFLQGHSTAEIAEIMGTHVDTIKQVRASEEFKGLINTISAEIIATARTFLTASSMKAVRTLMESMDSHNDRVRLAAACEVLDRIGLKSPDKLEILAKSDNLNGLDDDALKDLIKMNLHEILPLKEGSDAG